MSNNNNEDNTPPYIVRVQTPYSNHDFECTAADIQFWEDHMKSVSEIQPHEVIRVDWMENGWRKNHVKTLYRASEDKNQDHLHTFRQDSSAHWYMLPVSEAAEFDELELKIEDSPIDNSLHNQFNSKFRQYRISNPSNVVFTNPEV